MDWAFYESYASIQAVEGMIRVVASA